MSTSGYFPDEYWGADYWGADYWGEVGSGVVIVNVYATIGGSSSLTADVTVVQVASPGALAILSQFRFTIDLESTEIVVMDLANVASLTTSTGAEVQYEMAVDVDPSTVVDLDSHQGADLTTDFLPGDHANVEVGEDLGMTIELAITTDPALVTTEIVDCELALELLVTPLFTLEVLAMAETNIGDDVVLTCTFRNALTDTLVDPTVVTLRVKTPTGEIQDYDYPTNITRVSSGVYRAIIDITSAGNWAYKWTSTGTGKGAEQSNFLVEPDII